MSRFQRNPTTLHILQRVHATVSRVSCCIMLTSGGFWFDPDAMTIWPDKVDGLCFGGDYNPEQWPEATWRDDVRLMREAGVNLVTVGVFAWALLEREEGRYDFGWLDRVLDLLHEGGIRVDLATATAAPPPWFTRRYPQSQPVTREGQLLWPGRRQLYCPSSPEYRAAATEAWTPSTRGGPRPSGASATATGRRSPRRG